MVEEHDTGVTEIAELHGKAQPIRHAARRCLTMETSCSLKVQRRIKASRLSGRVSKPFRSEAEESNDGAYQSSYKRPFMRTDRGKSQNRSIAGLPDSHK